MFYVVGLPFTSFSDKLVTRGTSADRETEAVRVTARGLSCVRVTRAVLRLCVVWVCGLQLTGREEDRRAL